MRKSWCYPGWFVTSGKDHLQMDIVFYKQTEFPIFVQMKLISTILIAVILISAAYPCVDAENISFVDQVSLNIPSEDMHNESEDNCSQFCICACCSISYSIEFQKFINNTIPSTNSSIHFQDNYLFNPFLSIWQPPKV